MSTPATEAALPRGWRWAMLGEVCDVTPGQSPPGDTYRDTPEGMPFFQGKADFGPRHPIARKWCAAPLRTAHPGDILISIRAPVGPTNVADTVCCIGRGLAALRPRDCACPEFILLALRLNEKAITDLGSGSTFSAIGRRDLARFAIPFPPLPEQRRIAALVTEQLAAVDRARAAAEAQLQATQALPAAFLREVFDSPEARQWPEKRLREVCTVHPGQHILQADYNHQNTGVGYITGPADFGPIVPAVTKWTRVPKAWCQPGDVLLTVKGAGVGKLNLAPQEPVAIGRQLMAIRPRPGLATQAYLFWLLSQEVRQVVSQAPGSTVPGIPRPAIEALAVSVPPVEAQVALTELLDEQVVHSRSVAFAALEQLELVRRTPSALLSAAFTGEL